MPLSQLAPLPLFYSVLFLRPSWPSSLPLPVCSRLICVFLSCLVPRGPPQHPLTIASDKLTAATAADFIYHCTGGPTSYQVGVSTATHPLGPWTPPPDQVRIAHRFKCVSAPSSTRVE